MVQLEIGVGEVLAVLGSVVGFGWALLKLSLSQFEKRLTDKFSAVNGLLLDVKKLELELVKRDGHYSQMFATKDDLQRHQDKYEKTVERIFTLLTHMSEKLDSKVAHDDCERMMLRKSDRMNGQ